MIDLNLFAYKLYAKIQLPFSNTVKIGKSSVFFKLFYDNFLLQQ
jgi:hypothetical protein